MSDTKLDIDTTLGREIGNLLDLMTDPDNREKISPELLAEVNALSPEERGNVLAVAGDLEKLLGKLWDQVESPS